MSNFLGFDTSNYTTSVAIFNSESREVMHRKKLLPVKCGSLGFRQSDVVFSHVKAMPSIITELFATSQCDAKSIKAVGVSARPCDRENSYMPCFSVGMLMATSIAAVLGTKCYEFTHQAGHITSALYSSGRMDLINKKFLAFHVSGGTTEAVIVSPSSENIFQVQCVSRSLDAKAGQIIDRVGSMLGLSFPAGREIDVLARTECRVRKPTLKGENCCLSGLENICRKMVDECKSREEIASYCITYIMKTLEAMCDRVLGKYGDMPVVFSGGVMCNSLISTVFKRKYDAIFATPELSSDNAVGISILCAYKSGWL